MGITEEEKVIEIANLVCRIYFVSQKYLKMSHIIHRFIAFIANIDVFS